jgi:hypothetical protein
MDSRLDQVVSEFPIVTLLTNLPASPMRRLKLDFDWNPATNRCLVTRFPRLGLLSDDLDDSLRTQPNVQRRSHRVPGNSRGAMHNRRQVWEVTLGV